MATRVFFTKLDGSPVAVNPRKVDHYHAHNGYVKIAMADGWKYDVRETFEEVRSEIDPEPEDEETAA